MSSASVSSPDNGNLLQFEEAMVQFNAMFPQLGSTVVESVLRTCDGDVSRTIDELLRQSSKESENAADERHKRKSNTPPRDPCANDERIALLVQNREFLRYLRCDPNFQRELFGRSRSSNHRHGNRGRTQRHHSPSQIRHLPALLASSHPSQSPNTHYFFRSSENVFSSPVEEDVRRVPDGPLVKFRVSRKELAIPDGPLIDYVGSDQRPSAGGWAQRLKAKITMTKKSSSTTDYALMPTSSLDNLKDFEIESRNGEMDRESKGPIFGLARKLGKLRADN